MKIYIEIIPADGSWTKAAELIEKIRESTEQKSVLATQDEVYVKVKAISAV